MSDFTMTSAMKERLAALCGGPSAGRRRGSGKTMQALEKRGLVHKDGKGKWRATEAGQHTAISLDLVKPEEHRMQLAVKLHMMAMAKVEECRNELSGQAGNREAKAACAIGEAFAYFKASVLIRDGE